MSLTSSVHTPTAQPSWGLPTRVTRRRPGPDAELVCDTTRQGLTLRPSTPTITPSTRLLGFNPQDVFTQGAGQGTTPCRDTPALPVRARSEIK